MMANEERLALILEANDKATAVLQKVRKEIEDTAGASSKGSKEARGLGGELDRFSDTKLLKGARAMSAIGRAANDAQFGTKEATRAMGELAETVALASGNAKLAGWAIALNAAVVAGGALVSLLQQASEATKPTEQQLKHIAKLTADRVGAELQGAQAAVNSALDSAANTPSLLHRLLHKPKKEGDDGLLLQAAKDFSDSFGFSSESERRAKTALGFKDLITDKAVESAAAERLRVVALADQTVEMNKQHQIGTALGEVQLRAVTHQVTSLGLEKAQAVNARQSADAQVASMFRFRDANGQIHQLTAAELTLKGKLIENNRENYGLTILTAKAKYDDQIATTRYSQDQTIWYAQRRLTQSDYQTSQDTLLRSFTDQLYTLQNSGKEAADITAEADRLLTIYNAQLAALQQQHDLQTRRLRAQNNVDQSEGGLFGPGNAGDQYKAKIDAIEEARLAAIKAGEDEVEANRRAENEKRKLQRDTINEAKKNYRTIEDVLLASHSRQVKAVGHAVQTMRRLEIGAEGSKAAVMALREGAQALASFAHGDFAGGGLHLASAAQFAATAALAAQESLGGGGSASGGGGGGGGSVSGAGTFEPRDNGQGGSQSIYLITHDPYGREQIQQLAWELDRAGVMKRPPTQIPPTTGIRAA